MNGERFFMEYLHLMYNKPNLLRMNGNEVSPYPFAMEYKERRLTMQKDEKADPTVEKKQIENMIYLLERMFRRFQGGGVSLEQLKERIRDKVSMIQPRSH